MAAIWVADDDADYRELLAMVLETQCCEPVRSFASGREVLRALDGSPPARYPRLLLLDFHMPGCDAPDVLRAIRAARVQVPAIVLSGAATSEERAWCEREGALAFLEKPARIEDLAPVLQRLTALSRPSGQAPLPHP